MSAEWSRAGANRTRCGQPNSVEIDPLQMISECGGLAEHRRRVEVRLPDIKDHVLPTWEEVASGHYEPWDRERLVLDTAISSLDHLVDRTEARRLPKINRWRTRLSPPSLRQRNNASTYHDKNDDDGKRLRQAQGLVPVVPKLKHALASIQSAPSTEKISLCRKDVPLRAKMQCYVSSRAV
jgi:hypothetical protein